MTRFLYLIPLALAIGCDAFAPPPEFKSLSDARKGFVTQIVTTGEMQDLRRYRFQGFGIGNVRRTARAAGSIHHAGSQDGTRHPAIIWITGVTAIRSAMFGLLRTHRTIKRPKRSETLAL